MRLDEVIGSKRWNPDQMQDQFRDFLMLCMKELKLEKLPRIEWIINGEHHKAHQSFGSFHNNDQLIKVEINNRHPLDVMRTLAHELVHYKQWTEGRIKPDSGETGSEIENEAHAVAGVIMRHFDHSNPKAFDLATLNESKPKKKDDKPSAKVLQSAVTDLENKLLATNKRNHTYKEIDTMMKAISKDKKITAKQLHDVFVKKHGVSPDEWIEYQEIG
jgi:hypothetical protein